MLGAVVLGQDLVRVNAPGVHAAWLERMRGAKLGGLRARTGAMAEDHERALDARDGIIQVSALQESPACIRRHASYAGGAGLTTSPALPLCPDKT
jgi:hypothetical protein